MASFSQGFLSNLGRPAMTQSMFDLGTAVGKMPQQYREKQKTDQFNELSAQAQASIANNNSDELLATAQKMSSLGMVEQGQALAKQAQQIKQRNAMLTAAQSMGERLGLPPEEASTLQGLGVEQLAVTMQDMRKRMLDKIPTQTPVVRKSMAQAAGIGAEKFAELELGKVTDEAFNKLIAGQGGEVKFFQDEKGELTTRRVNNGLVFQPEKGQWVDPSTLKLSKSPQISKVETVTNKFAEDLAKEGAKSFSEQFDAAKKSRDALGSVLRSRPMIDTMFTGTLAETKLEVTKIAKAFGFPVGDLNQSIANSEVYAAETGTRVAEYITNLGAGTGLSDADREFAKAVVGGLDSYDAESLKAILTKLEAGARRNIADYEAAYQRVKSKMTGPASGALAFFPETFDLSEFDRPESRSTSAQAFLDAARARRTGEGGVN